MKRARWLAALRAGILPRSAGPRRQRTRSSFEAEAYINNSTVIIIDGWLFSF